MLDFLPYRNLEFVGGILLCGSLAVHQEYLALEMDRHTSTHDFYRQTSPGNATSGHSPPLQKALGVGQRISL